jgi:hypothetical protein
MRIKNLSKANRLAMRRGLKVALSLLKDKEKMRQLPLMI